MPNVVIPPPTLDIERELLQQGVSSIAGADEAGVGALAGPIVVGMVQLPLPTEDTTQESELAFCANSSRASVIPAICAEAIGHIGWTASVRWGRWGLVRSPAMSSMLVCQLHRRSIWRTNVR
jgi:hypothetical protein